MLGPYNQRPMFYDEGRRYLRLEWEYPPRASRSLFETLEHEPMENLMLQAEIYRLADQAPHGPSLGSRMRARMEGWLDEARCRFYSYRFRQPCPEFEAQD
jgi:hypothetical protein